MTCRSLTREPFPPKQGLSAFGASQFQEWLHVGGRTLTKYYPAIEFTRIMPYRFRLRWSSKKQYEEGYIGVCAGSSSRMRLITAEQAAFDKASVVRRPCIPNPAGFLMQTENGKW